MSQSLAELYLSGRGGSTLDYTRYLEQGQRIGQAFFNALSGEDQERVRGTIHDPFYHNSNYHIQRAIEWLLETEDEEKQYLIPEQWKKPREGEM